MLSKPDLLETIQCEGLQPVKRGGRWWLRCPFHSDTKPSLVIDEAKQVWFCHGCQTGGDVITFIMLLYKLSFSEACRYLNIARESSPHRKTKAKSKTQPKTPERQFEEEFGRLFQMRPEVEFRAAFQQWLDDRLAFLDAIIDELERTLETVTKTSKAFDLLYLDLQKWQTEREILTNGSLAEKLAIAERDPRWRLVLIHLKTKQRSKG